MEGIQASASSDSTNPSSSQSRDDQQTATIVYWCSVPVTSTIEDSNSEDGRNFRAALKITANNLGSPVWWGRTAENPDVVVAVICKDTYSTYKYAFKEDPQQEPWRYAASSLFLKVCTDYPKKHHVALDEDPTPMFENPMTLLAMAYFSPDEGAAPVRAHFEDRMLKYNIATKEGTHSRSGASHQYLGWSKEIDLSYASFDGVRKSGMAYYMISGWPSLEACHKFHLESGMREEIEVLLSGGADGWRLIHVHFEKVTPDS